ncbi:MAG: hypothetical protein GX572_00155 [Clostridia bacterium]|mgnify:CR=1 FL=1|nr:hypothetical protein [Clostridia bacterium]
MIEVKVKPGNCGMDTTICVESADQESARISIDSLCPFILKLARELGEVDAYEVCFTPVCDSPVYRLAGLYCKHPCCPVPAAIIKGVEAACGLALPQDVTIKIEKK